jgi:hypothetical protein
MFRTATIPAVTQARPLLARAAVLDPGPRPAGTPSRGKQTSMGKNGTGWDFFEGPQCDLTGKNKTRRHILAGHHSHLGEASRKQRPGGPCMQKRRRAVPRFFSTRPSCNQGIGGQGRLRHESPRSVCHLKEPAPSADPATQIAARCVPPVAAGSVRRSRDVRLPWRRLGERIGYIPRADCPIS